MANETRVATTAEMLRDATTAMLAAHDALRYSGDRYGGRWTEAVDSIERALTTFGIDFERINR